MLMPWESKKKENKALGNQNIDSEIDGMEALTTEGSKTPIPAFFRSRAIGWFAVSFGIVALTALWEFGIAGSTTGVSSMTGGAAVAAVLCAVNGIRTIISAKTQNYFTLRLTCTDTRAQGLLENAASYINPLSNTAFRNTQQVSFVTNTGTKVFFIYEKGRNFLKGARYDFYFNKPPNGEKVTVDMLERLRIDHAIVADELSREDFSDEIIAGNVQLNERSREG